MKTKKNNQEEVDLGQLFEAIGRMFKRFFDFIGGVLYKLFLAFVWFVFFLKKNIIILMAALVVGLIIGFSILAIKKPIYRSSAVIKQNYRTGEHLYESIDYYNGLISDGDIDNLAKSLDLTKEEATTIQGFEISTDFDDNDKMEQYLYYIEEKDTSFVKPLDFETFSKNLEEHEHQFQKISMAFSQRGNFDKTLDGLVKSLNTIDYFKKLQSKDLKELERRMEILKLSLAKSDSLRKIYQEVLRMPSTSGESQTSITIENAQDNKQLTREYDLFINDIELMRELVDLERKADDITNIVEVIAINQNSGKKFSEKELFGYNMNTKYYYAILLFALTMLFLLAKELSRYLERYKTKI